VPDEITTNDGKHINYTSSGSGMRDVFRSCDPELYDDLVGLLADGVRRVARLQALGSLPESARHFVAPLDFRGTGRWVRPGLRFSWLKDALDETRDCDLVFIDPDNGLETASVGRYGARGPKYAYLDDLELFVRREQSLVIYQHMNRTASASVQARLRVAQIQDRLGVACLPPLRFRRGSGRLYLIVPAARHRELLRSRMTQLLESPWALNGHFEPVLRGSGYCSTLKVASHEGMA
jgi:hypothetical protein